MLQHIWRVGIETQDPSTYLTLGRNLLLRDFRFLHAGGSHVKCITRLHRTEKVFQHDERSKVTADVALGRH